jgi:hypothetical protein
MCAAQKTLLCGTVSHHLCWQLSGCVDLRLILVSDANIDQTESGCDFAAHRDKLLTSHRDVVLAKTEATRQAQPVAGIVDRSSYPLRLHLPLSLNPVGKRLSNGGPLLLLAQTCLPPGSIPRLQGCLTRTWSTIDAASRLQRHLDSASQ